MKILDFIKNRTKEVFVMLTGIGLVLISVSVVLVTVPASPNKNSDTSKDSEYSGYPGDSTNDSDGSDNSDFSGILSKESSKESDFPGSSMGGGSMYNSNIFSSSSSVTGDRPQFKWPKTSGIAKAYVKKFNGLPAIFVNGSRIPGIMFFGNTDMNRRTDIIAEEVKKAAQANIHFHSIISSPEIGSVASDEVKYFDLSNDLDVIIDNDPDSFILLRVNVGKYYGTEGYPASEIVKYVTSRSENLPMVSIASQKWLTDTRKMLSDLVKYVRSHPVYSKHVVGYHLDCGEWFQYMFRENGTDISAANSAKFREWLTSKYKSDNSLRAAWSDSSVTLSTAVVPTNLPGNLSGVPEKFTLMLAKSDRRYIDYLDYIGDHVSGIIENLASVIKTASSGENIVIAFYGYLFELADAQSGHFKLEKLLVSSNIDGFASPECYLDRNVGELFPRQPAGSTGAYMTAVDTVQRAGKMWFVESDQRTFINRAGATTEHDSYLVPAQSVDEMIGLSRRDVGSAMLRGASIWFMDLWSVGWLDDQKFWDNNGKLADLYMSYTSNRSTMTKFDVAFVVDEAAMSLVSQPTDSAWHFLSYQRYDFYRAGLSFGMYTLKDLIDNKVNDAKLIFILTPFRLSTAQTDKIIANARGKTIVFSYGFGETSTSDVEKLTGMKISRADGKTSVKLFAEKDTESFGIGDDSFGQVVMADPRWIVNSGSDRLLGKYSDGNIGFAAKNLGTHKAIFFGGMRMNSDVLRAIAKYAGVHVFSENDDVVMAGDNLVVYHSSKDSIKTISFPVKCDVYDYFNDEWHIGVSSFKFQAAVGETRYFFYGKKAEIEKNFD